ncbi:LysR family transcriptional regulator [Roseibium algae]|uniref:LysR family transcriptional regulator n=1 Tax=Roseibium algae TaxID=3123038 RepID=A0ABU8TQ04_9HYPH
MDIDQLRTFDRVVRDGSFTKAAARLNVTQATVSMRIRALEAYIGAQLFIRGRQVQLTDQGLGFLPYCRRMLGVLQEARETLRRAERGRIAVGSLSTMIMPMVSKALLRFQRRHKEIDVIIREGRHNQIATMLHERDVELAVICWPNLDPLLTNVEPLLIIREDAPLVASPALSEKLGLTPSFNDILDKAPRYLHLNWWQVAPTAATSLAQSPLIQVELPTNPGRSLIEAGEGIGFFVRSAIADSLADGRLVEIRPTDLEPLHRDIALVVRKRKALEEGHLLEFANEIATEGRLLGRILKDNLTTE